MIIMDLLLYLYKVIKVHVVYAVEIPKGTIALQAQNLKYYRRYNFESVATRDHEIRDESFHFS